MPCKIQKHIRFDLAELPLRLSFHGHLDSFQPRCCLLESAMSAPSFAALVSP